LLLHEFTDLNQRKADEGAGTLHVLEGAQTWLKGGDDDGPVLSHKGVDIVPVLKQEPSVRANIPHDLLHAVEDGPLSREDSIAIHSLMGRKKKDESEERKEKKRKKERKERKKRTSWQEFES